MNRPIIGIAAIIFNDKNEVLLLHRKSKVGKNTWGFPGGKLDINEGLEDCIKRETKEECNINIIDLEFVNLTNDIMYDIEQHYVTLYYKILSYDGELKNMEPNKCDEIKWFNINNLPINLFSPIKNLLKKDKLFINSLIN